MTTTRRVVDATEGLADALDREMGAAEAAPVSTEEEVEDYTAPYLGATVRPRFATTADMGMDGWNGKKSRWTLGHAILHDHMIVGAGDIIEFEASWDKEHGRWCGPDASHVEFLKGLGYFLNTKEYTDRERRQIQVNDERGAYRPDDDPDKPHGLEELTADELRFLVARFMGRDPRSIVRAELLARREDPDQAPKFAGSAGPGAIKSSARGR